jgi:SAM-dependent methyltransferase
MPPAATAGTRSFSRATVTGSWASTARRSCSTGRDSTRAGDYRGLPFEDGSFDAVLNLFTSFGFWGEEGDRQALREFRRVLRPGGRLVLETMHRDRLIHIFQPRGWNQLPDGGLLFEERSFDPVSGMITTVHALVNRDGGRQSTTYDFRIYTATELVALAQTAGFEAVECYGDVDRTPLSAETRLLLAGEALS